MADRQKYETLSLTYGEDNIARLEMGRPELLNRIDEVAHRELTIAFRELSEAPRARAVLWTARGRAFSAGGDLNLVREQFENGRARALMFQQALDIVHSLLDIPIPVIVALHGDVYGLGSSLILLCDAVIAVRTAKIADPHVKVGMVAGDGGCLVWPASIGMMKAKKYLLTGDAVSAEDAEAMGLVTDLVDTPDACWAVSEAYAKKIAKLSPLAVSGTKRSLNTILRARAAEVLELSLVYEQRVITHPDSLEAIAAFKEKRDGIYIGDKS